MIERLQRHNFQWEDKPFDTLYKKYPKCKSALMWWCNAHPQGSRFNISVNKYLKEFIIQTPRLKYQINVARMPKSCLLKGY